MAGEPKTVRLVDAVSGVTVTANEETAANLSGFEPEKSTNKSSSSKSSK